MREEIYNTIKVLVQNDNSITQEHRQSILKACRTPKPAQPKRMYTSSAAASVLDCHVKTLYRYVARNVLHPIRLSSRRIRFDANEVDAFAARGLEGREQAESEERAD